MRTGAGRGAPVPGVPRRRHRAAGHRRRRRAAAAAAAAATAAPRRRRRWSSRSSRRCATRRRTSRAWTSRARWLPPKRPPASSSEWVALDGAKDIPRGHLAQVTSGLVIANVAGTLLAYRNRCAKCGGELDERAAARRHADLRRVRRGRSTCRARGAARTATGCSSNRCRCCVSRATVKVALSGAIAPPRPRGRTAARRGGALRAVPDRARPRTTATCCTSTSGASSACARRAGRCARATPSTGPRGVRTLWLDDFELPDELWAQLQIPIGLTFVLRSSMTGTVVALYPSPAGATESELDLFAWAAMCDANPVLERLESDAEALVVNRLARAAAVRDRADRPVLPARRPDQVALGGHLRRDGDRVRGRRVLRRAARARAGGCVVTLDVDRPRPVPKARAADPVFTVLGVEPVEHALAPTLRFQLHVSDPEGRAIYAIALQTQIQVDPARRVLRRRDARAPGRAVRRARALGRDDAQLQLGARRLRSCRASPARRRSSSRCRAPTTSSSRRASTSTRCATASCRCRSTSPGWCSTATRASSCA